MFRCSHCDGGNQVTDVVGTGHTGMVTRRKEEGRMENEQETYLWYNYYLENEAGVHPMKIK
jgi:hypothetical protein